jgi:hypothetical protein
LIDYVDLWLLADKLIPDLQVQALRAIKLCATNTTREALKKLNLVNIYGKKSWRDVN